MPDTLPLRSSTADPIEATRDHLAAGRPPSLAAAVEPLLIDRKDLSRLLCRSVASLDRDTAAGRIPRPLRIGAGVRWKLSEIRLWVAANCPDRSTWEAIRDADEKKNRRR